MLILPRRKFLAAPAVIIPGRAVAQIMWPPQRSQYGVGGVGDIVSGWDVYWGLRAYSRAVAATGTQKSIQVIRASDSTTKDIFILPTGYADFATLSAFLSGTTGAITLLYDQSGNGKNFQPVTSLRRPSVNLTGGPSSQPSIQFAQASQQGMVTISSTVSSGQDTDVWVGIRTGNFTTLGPALSSSAVGTGFITTANKVYATSGTVLSATASDSVWHAVACTYNVPTPGGQLVVDGVLTTGNTGGTASSGLLGVGYNISTATLEGRLMEGGRFNTNLTSTQLKAITAQQHTAWGF